MFGYVIHIEIHRAFNEKCANYSIKGCYDHFVSRYNDSFVISLRQNECFHNKIAFFYFYLDKLLYICKQSPFLKYIINLYERFS